MVTAVVMAGGNGTRMRGKKEKPLIEVRGIPMIQHVIDALLASKKISEVIILTSPNTPKTSKFACINRIFSLSNTRKWLY